MEEEELKERFRQYSIRIIKMVDAVPTNRVSAWAIAKQVVRSGTSPEVYVSMCYHLSQHPE